MAPIPDNLFSLVNESADYLKWHGVNKIDAAVILGSGLSGVVDKFNKKSAFNYADVPHFVAPGVKDHRGRIVVTECKGKSILFFVGRVHYYEGYDMWQVSFPVRVAHALGAEQLIVTGAAGGLNINYNEGDIVLLTDHINLQSENPLRGINDPRLGLRFPDMSQPYGAALISTMEHVMHDLKIKVKKGVYVSLPGPSLETRAEYQYLHHIGADLVGMSIVPEVIVGVQCGLQIAGICVISNVCYPPEKVSQTTIEDVLATVQMSATDISRLIEGLWSA